MSFSAKFKRAIFDKKMDAFDRRVGRGLSDLMRAQHMSADELAALNWAARLALVTHCADKIPFYQSSFKAIGFEPGDLKEEADWNRLPVLEKDQIRNFASSLHDPAFPLDVMSESTTGGTSGQPLKTYQDPRIHLAGLSWRMMDWWGIVPSDNAGYLYRAVPTGMSRILKDVALYPTKRAYISATAMTKIHLFVKSHVR